MSFDPVTASARRSLLQRLRSRLFPAIDPLSPQEIRAKQLRDRRNKPPQKTILRRSTYRNLQYLVNHGLTPPFREKFVVAKSMRQKAGDTFLVICTEPSHGV